MRQGSSLEENKSLINVLIPSFRLVQRGALQPLSSLPFELVIVLTWFPITTSWNPKVSFTELDEES